MSYQLLIVDDEVLIRKALSQYIDWESLNCVVHATASNGKEAIKIIEENKIDIVITDVKMPLIDGIELSRYICKNHPNITTVILSGYAEFEYAQSAIQYHVSQYLLKPISKEKIMSCIKDIVKQKATELPADDSMNTAETAPKYSIFIKQAINYIDEHLTDDMTLETIAESVHSNASYLSRIFKKEVGTSVITYITDLRIKKAKDLLEHSDLKTFEISDAVGIHDPAYFSVLFKKYTGMSPKSYRNKADSLCPTGNIIINILHNTMVSHCMQGFEIFYNISIDIIFFKNLRCFRSRKAFEVTISFHTVNHKI